METVEFKLNGKPISLKVNGERMLLWVLQADLNLPGAKYGCSEVHSGACSVIINHRVERSCQVPVKDMRGKELLTIDGLAVLTLQRRNDRA